MNRSTVLVQGLGLGVLSPKLVFPAGRNFARVKPMEIDGIDKIKANWMLMRKGSSQRSSLLVPG